jgi:hypothetical protein
MVATPFGRKGKKSRKESSRRIKLAESESKTVYRITRTPFDIKLFLAKERLKRAWPAASLPALELGAQQLERANMQTYADAIRVGEVATGIYSIAATRKLKRDDIIRQLSKSRQRLEDKIQSNPEMKEILDLGDAIQIDNLILARQKNGRLKIRRLSTKSKREIKQFLTELDEIGDILAVELNLRSSKSILGSWTKFPITPKSYLKLLHKFNHIYAARIISYTHLMAEKYKGTKLGDDFEAITKAGFSAGIKRHPDVKPPKEIEAIINSHAFREIMPKLPLTRRMHILKLMSAYAETLGKKGWVKEK